MENELRDFRLGGAELPEAAKARFRQLQEELAALSSRFQDNVLDATNDFALFVTDAAQLAGIPADVLEAAKAAAAKDGREGWKLTLHMPCYLPVMQYADHRALREQMYRAYVTRASEFGKPEWDNTPLIARILEMRAEVASPARLRHLRRGLARAEDGRLAGGGGRLPGGPGGAREALRRARHGRAGGTSRAPSWGSPRCGPGTWPG